MSAALLSPNVLMEEASLHASCWHPEGSYEYLMEVIHYFLLRIDHEVAPQIARLMVVLYGLDVTDEQIDLIWDHVCSKEASNV